MKYYTLKNILDRNATYNIIIGERSNGKTYSVLKYGVEQYAASKKQIAIVRRWQDDFTGKRGATMFDALINNGEIARITKNEWTGVYYYSSRWFLCRYENTEKERKRIVDETPFAYGFALTSETHDKSTSYPNITTIVFDEFLTRNGYINDEFVLFLNTISTIVRDRADVKIFMLGNTVNKYCPYFDEMGLKHVAEMKQGEIDVYKYGDSRLSVAIEYCKPNQHGKPSDFYFAFDNPKLKMITGGSWEIGIYPHCPVKYAPKHVIFTFFIVFNHDTLQCEVVSINELDFIFIHAKTTPLKDTENDLIYTTEFSPRPNYRRKLTRPTTDLERKLAAYFAADKVFYSTNTVGEIVRNYLMWCNQ